MSLIEEITQLVDKVESALSRVGSLESELAAVKNALAGTGTTGTVPAINTVSISPPPGGPVAAAPADPVETVGPAAGDAEAPAETPEAPEEPSTVPGDAAPEFGTADQVYPPAGDRGAAAVEEPVAEAAPAESVPAPDAPAPAPSE